MADRMMELRQWLIAGRMEALGDIQRGADKFRDLAERRRLHDVRVILQIYNNILAKLDSIADR